MGIVFDGVVWAGLAMIWAWPVCVASVLEVVFKKLELMTFPCNMISISVPSVSSGDLAAYIL